MQSLFPASVEIIDIITIIFKLFLLLLFRQKPSFFSPSKYICIDSHATCQPQHCNSYSLMGHYCSELQGDRHFRVSLQHTGRGDFSCTSHRGRPVTPALITDFAQRTLILCSMAKPQQTVKTMTAVSLDNLISTASYKNPVLWLLTIVDKWLLG